MSDDRGVGYADQHAAATDEAIDQVRRLRARMGGYGCDFHQSAEVPDWMRAAIGAHEDAVAAGRGVGCAHVARSRGPVVTHVALWAPGTVACGPCTRVGELFSTLPAELSCTACGSGSPPPEFFGALSLGPFIVEFLLCEPDQAELVKWSLAHGNAVAGGAAAADPTTTE